MHSQRCSGLIQATLWAAQNFSSSTGEASRMGNDTCWLNQKARSFCGARECTGEDFALLIREEEAAQTIVFVVCAYEPVLAVVDGAGWRLILAVLLRSSLLHGLLCDCFHGLLCRRFNGF